MGKRKTITTTALMVRDGKDEAEIKETAETQNWPRGFTSIFLRRRRIGKTIRRLEKEGTPRDMSRFMHERPIGTR